MLVSLVLLALGLMLHLSWRRWFAHTTGHAPKPYRSRSASRGIYRGLRTVATKGSFKSGRIGLQSLALRLNNSSTPRRTLGSLTSFGDVAAGSPGPAHPTDRPGQ